MNEKQKAERKHEIRVGLTVLIGLIILVVTILTVGENRGLLQDRYKLIVNMSRVNGLQTGAPVRLAGVRVGTVVRVSFPQQLDNQKIEVVLEIDKDVQPRIRQDSEAHIGTLGLLGDKFVGITLGSLERPMLRDNELIKSSDPIDIEKLMDEGVDVFHGLKEATQTINEIGNKINHGDGTLGLLINDPRMYFDLDRLLLITESIEKKIDQGEGTIAKLFQDPDLYSNLNSLLVSTRQLSDSLSTGGGTAGKIVKSDSLYNQFAEAINRFNSFTKKIDSGEGTIGKALNDQELYKEFIRVTGEIDSLIKDIRRNPQRYLKVEIF